MSIESREYQNFIVQRIAELVDSRRSIILELDCGMGKRVLMYRLVTEVFKDKKIVIFLQTHSSLEETALYLEKEYGGIKDLGVVKSGLNSSYRKYIIESNRVILSLPIVFSNTIKKYPELINDIDIVIVNEVDQIVRRVSHQRVLCVPWNRIMTQVNNASFVGMSGTLRDDHFVLDDDQLKLRSELKTLTDFIPDSSIITIEDFIDTDLKEYIKETEVHIHPVKDEQTAQIIQMITSQIKELREEILQIVSETSPDELPQLKQNFFQNISLVSVETDLVEKLNRLLLLRKYVYSMPASTYPNYLLRHGFDKNILSMIPKVSGKELEILKIVKDYKKVTILCSFLSTVGSLSQLLKNEGITTFEVTGKSRNKSEIIEQFKNSKERSALVLSPIGERDIDIPQTDLIIVYDLVNSPKTVYQKMKRSRGGEVFLLFYENTSEQDKVKRVVSEIAVRYPWSLIFYSDK
ncbi:MAG: DEAD/DEAH box helicase family protein [Candidatus Heimdallarchaeota archaeon]|nr:DEAD/DEAH box helicase family protein [Candidatus Heimdallarchaeota archaeon]